MVMPDELPLKKNKTMPLLEDNILHNADEDKDQQSAVIVKETETKA